MRAADVALRSLAVRLAALLSAIDRTACVLAGGSFAAGRADAYSDLDLYVITEHAVPRPVRHELLRTITDPRTVPFLDQPMRTGGLSETCKVAGRDVTILYRRAADVDAEVRALWSAPLIDPDREAAYGHELSRAESLADPLGLAAGWRRRLASYPLERTDRVAQMVASRFSAALERPDHAVQLAAPAVAWSVHRLCAEHGLWFPGSKRRPAVEHWSSPAREALRALEATMVESASAVELVSGLAALARDAAPDQAALTELLTPPSLPVDQWVNLGSDALGGRMQVAIDRADPFAAAHYLGRAIQAMAALGELPGQGLVSGSPADARRRLAEVWSRMLIERDLLNPYAEAAIRLAL